MNRIEAGRPRVIRRVSETYSDGEPRIAVDKRTGSVLQIRMILSSNHTCEGCGEKMDTGIKTYFTYTPDRQRVFRVPGGRRTVYYRYHRECLPEEAMALLRFFSAWRRPPQSLRFFSAWRRPPQSLPFG